MRRASAICPGLIPWTKLSSPPLVAEPPKNRERWVTGPSPKRGFETERGIIAFVRAVSDLGFGYFPLNHSGFENTIIENNTITPVISVLYGSLGSFAEFERSMVHERTHAGLAAARDRGGKFGPQGCRLGVASATPSWPRRCSI